MPKDDFMIACRPVKELPVPHGNNTTKDNCELCREEIWVSERSRVMQKELGARLFCAACSMDVMHDKPHMVIGNEGHFKGMNESPSVRKKGQFIPIVQTDGTIDDVIQKAKDGLPITEIFKEPTKLPPERN